MSEQQAAVAVGAEEAPRPSGVVKIVKIAAGVAILASLFYFGPQASGLVTSFALWVQAQGAWAPVVFILGYVGGTVAFAPGWILTGAGGIIFGLGLGTLYVFVASTIGSAAAFLIARYLARDWVAKKIQGNEKFAAIDRAVGKEGLKIVFLLRLTPVFPFSLGNYALGLTNVRFRDYLLAAFGTLPGTFLYVYYGKLAGDILAFAAGETEKGAEQWVAMGLGLAATIVVTTIVTRIALKTLKKATEGADDE